MTTRLQKILFTLICGAAITAGKCNQQAEEPTRPPPDAEADVEPAPPPEQIPPDEVAVPLYGAPAEPVEPPDQPMYGVPYE